MPYIYTLSLSIFISNSTMDVESSPKPVELIEESNSPSKTSSVLMLEKKTSGASIIDKYVRDEVPSYGFGEDRESRQEVGAADQSTRTEKYSKVPSLIRWKE